jgi:hypothetical protein
MQLGRRPLTRAAPSVPGPAWVPAAIASGFKLAAGGIMIAVLCSPPAGGPLEGIRAAAEVTLDGPRDRGRRGPRTTAKAAFMVTATEVSVDSQTPFKASFIFSLAAEKTRFGSEAA